MSALPASVGVLLRPMREHDLPAIVAIEARAYEFPWAEPIFADCLRVGYCCWSVLAQGELAGYGVLSIAAGEAHLLNLCIDPLWQRHGLARQTLQKLQDVARRLAATVIFLEVRPSNLAALALYYEAGFLQIATRRNYYPARVGREDAWVMSCDLNALHPRAGPAVVN